MSAEQVLLGSLSDEATAVVTSPAARLLVVAGAGAGKTEAMARRIAWWHAVEAVPKDRIVAFTFTERAAEEMKFRIRGWLQRVSDDPTDTSLGGMYVGTIHSFAIDQLRRTWPRSFHNDDILDDVARWSLIQQGFDWVLGLSALKAALGVGKQYGASRAATIEYFLRAYDLLNEYGQLDVELPAGPFPAFGREADWCKGAVLNTDIGSSDTAQAFATSAARYYAYLRCRHFLDFSTAQAELVRRLEAAPDVVAQLRQQTTHLVVDEVQDVNVVQHRLRELVTGEAGHLTAVGDHRQAIYSWRGGRTDLMADLAAALAADPQGDVLTLSANYRSTPRIVALSNAWNQTITPPGSMDSLDMHHGREQRLDIDSGHVRAIEFDDRAGEAEWIATSVATLVPDTTVGAWHDEAGDASERGLTYSDVAVLVRSATDARTYMAALQSHGIPAVVKAGPDLFAQPEVLLFACALTIAVGRETLLGAPNNAKSLPGRLSTILGVANGDAVAAVEAACGLLVSEGLVIESRTADRLITAARAVAVRLDEGKPDPSAASQVSSEGLRQFLSDHRPLRRVFPQTLFQLLLEEGGVRGWDDSGPRGVMAMFHLGQLSGLITGIETPGWTSPKAFRHQVSSLLLWASANAAPDEAPLLAAPDAVTVSTIHSVKGLQFAAVFVADVCRMRFPSSRARTVPPLPFNDDLSSDLRVDLLADNDDYDNERRLLYVAMTRAERYLFVTSSKPSLFFREVQPMCDEVGGETSGTTPLAVTHLASHASRENRLVTSFSDLRYYLECPHDFYLRKVLGFTPTIDQAFGYGRGVHNLLREIHLAPAEWAALVDRDDGQLESRLQDLVDQGLFYLRHTTGTPAENMRRKGMQVVADYVRTYEHELRDLEFEPEREFEVLLPEQNVLVGGAIDVVRRDDPPRVTIIDFKSGDHQSDKHDALDDEEMRLQVALYAIAARHELEYEPERGLVRYLGEKDEKRRELDVPLDDDAVAESHRTVAGLASGIQARRFSDGPRARGGHSAQERCATCDFERVCGVAPVRGASGRAKSAGAADARRRR